MPDPSAMRRPPFSVIACDLVCLGLAGWTVLCNAVMLLRGSALHLRVVAIVALLAVLVAMGHAWRRGRLGAWLQALDGSPAPSEPHEPAGTRAPSMFTRTAFLLAGIAAAVTVGMRRDLLEWWFLAVPFFAASYVVVARQSHRGLEPARRGGSEWALWAIALGCVLLTLALHVPNSDDSFYANLAVSVVDFPTQPILTHDNLHGIPGARLKPAAYGASSVEALTGLVGQLVGIQTLLAYHLLTPALAALLAPLALARLFRLLDGERWVWAVLAAVILLALDAGGGRGSFHDFAFVRLFQGKAMFVTTVAPALLAYGLRYALAPSTPRLLMLGAAQIAALGTTVTAFWAAPLLALTGTAVGLAPRLRSLATLGAAAASSSYLLALGLYFKWQPRLPGASGAKPRDVPADLLRHAYDMVLGHGAHLVASLGVALVAWPLCRTPLARRFAVVVPLLFLIGTGNPWLTQIVASATTPSIHWRVLWLLPIPVLAALGASSLLGAGSARFGALRWSLYALVLGAFLHHASPRLALARESLRWPQPKVNAHALHLARALVAALPPHRHAATPEGVARVLPMLNGYSYPLVTKAKYLRAGGDRDRRVKMTALLGRSRPGAANLRWAVAQLDAYRVEGVVAAAHSDPHKGWAPALRQAGFRKVDAQYRHEIWTRRLAPAK